MTEAWIGLGANLGERAAALDAALDAIDRRENTRVRAVSRYYFTPPWGDTQQPEFLNAVACVHTTLTAGALLDEMHRIEGQLGRERTDRRWGPRLIDLDLLVFGEARIDRPELTVPHPRIRERAFVLVPLLELAPELSIPGVGRVDALLARLDDNAVSGIRPGPDSNFRPQAND